MNEEEELKSTNISVLQKIQSELKAPKGQRNSFGNYNYRSAEDILDAVKPILAKYEVSLLASDDIVEIKDRVYIRTTVGLIKDGQSFANACAYAREPETKKGMDEAQITGSSASYSSKRALGNLLCISDSSLDPDATNTHGASKPTKTNKTQANKTQKDILDDDWI